MLTNDVCQLGTFSSFFSPPLETSPIMKRKTKEDYWIMRHSTEREGGWTETERDRERERDHKKKYWGTRHVRKAFLELVAQSRCERHAFKIMNSANAQRGRKTSLLNSACIAYSRIRRNTKLLLFWGWDILLCPTMEYWHWGLPGIFSISLTEKWISEKFSQPI